MRRIFYSKLWLGNWQRDKKKITCDQKDSKCKFFKDGQCALEGFCSNQVGG